MLKIILDSRVRSQTKPTRKNLSAGRKLYMGGAKPFGCYPCQAMMKGIPGGQLFWVIKNGSEGTELKADKDLEDNQVWQIVS